MTYEEDKAAVPPADPANPELRLLRAVYGLCPDCDREDEHDHRVPAGTLVLYHDRVHVVRRYNDLDRRSDLTDDDKALHYPDGIAYELWPQDVPFKFGYRSEATYFVRRTSFTVLGEGTTEEEVT